MKNIIFLVGGPGSGKNILLETIYSFGYKEYTLERLESFINKNSDLDEMIVITGNPQMKNKIIDIKEQLENEYNISMIFVNVDVDTVKERLKTRDINENIIIEKVNNCKELIDVYKNIFNNFLVYDNNTDILEQDFDKIKTFIKEIDYINEIKKLFGKLSKNVVKTSNNIPSMEDDIRTSGLLTGITPQNETLDSLGGGDMGLVGIMGNTSNKEEPQVYNSNVIEPVQKKNWKKVKRILFKG